VKAFLSDRLNLAWVISGLLLVVVVLLVPNDPRRNRRPRP
jgi:hypothetical protein